MYVMRVSIQPHCAHTSVKHIQSCDTEKREKRVSRVMISNLPKTKLCMPDPGNTA